MSELALIVMLALIAVDIVTRSVFNFSFEAADEIGGYMLVAIAFLSLAGCQASGSFHNVEFLQTRLSERGHAVSRIFFNGLSLAASSVLLWQFVRMVMSSWRFGDRAPTYLETPLWLPRSLLAVGMAGLCYVLALSLLADIKQLLRPNASGGRRSDGA